ncbi:MAG: TIGR02206 family membrane protein [Chloroflexota bacterium]
MNIFAKDWTGAPFHFLGIEHLTALFLLVVLNFLLFRLRGAKEEQRRRAALMMAAILWLNEVGWHVWNYAVGQWTIQTMLPLHVCSLLVWTSGFMLVAKNYTIYEFCYFLGIGGAMQALLTPDLGIYGFPHYRFFQTFISHGLIITAAIYMTVVEGFRPTWKSFVRVAVIANLYMGVVFVINSWIGSNYMFINHKPETPSLLDLLPPWPYYLLYEELIGFVVFLLLYLPFALMDMRKKSRLQQT